MANFKLSVDIDNAAFADRPQGSELGRILHWVAGHIERGHTNIPIVGANGNLVGKAVVLNEGETCDECGTDRTRSPQ